MGLWDDPWIERLIKVMFVFAVVGVCATVIGFVALLWWGIMQLVFGL